MPTSVLGPWIAAHAVGFAFLALVLRWPVIARGVLSLAFLAGAVATLTIALTTPELPVGLARWATETWAELLTGPFAAHAALSLGVLAAVGAALALLLVLGRERASRVGLGGAVVLFVAAAPLGLGAAFPATLLLALGALILARTDLRQSLVDELRAYHPPPRHPVHTIAELSHAPRAGHLGHVAAPWPWRHR